MGHACVYDQVLKTCRNHHIVRVERRLKISTARRLKEALLESEDSETLNTSFVERLNLTIRQDRRICAGGRRVTPDAKTSSVRTLSSCVVITTSSAAIEA